ncbi:MAG: hypothetical protein OI74_01310 [Gammaproteobacteria bacterium (ex Lamellibrachia satsuma)]|nr:MAG: hypothetical protein OI74_01310 [Gammaproteobacteria bacterium (ex Lamellibrachia satsuma)]RRS36791.1 MAG: hypothetical protein NV67_04990 [Gammaproteobacteria bacterium (ex Lamellibrachia satsuma)]
MRTRITSYSNHGAHSAPYIETSNKRLFGLNAQRLQTRLLLILSVLFVLDHLSKLEHRLLFTAPEILSRILRRFTVGAPLQ